MRLLVINAKNFHKYIAYFHLYVLLLVPSWFYYYFIRKNSHTDTHYSYHKLISTPHYNDTKFFALFDLDILSFFIVLFTTFSRVLAMVSGQRSVFEAKNSFGLTVSIIITCLAPPLLIIRRYTVGSGPDGVHGRWIFECLSHRLVSFCATRDQKVYDN